MSTSASSQLKAGKEYVWHSTFMKQPEKIVKLWWILRGMWIFWSSSQGSREAHYCAHRSSYGLSTVAWGSKIRKERHLLVTHCQCALNREEHSVAHATRHLLRSDGSRGIYLGSASCCLFCPQLLVQLCSCASHAQARILNDHAVLWDILRSMLLLTLSLSGAMPMWKLVTLSDKVLHLLNLTVLDFRLNDASQTTYTRGLIGYLTIQLTWSPAPSFLLLFKAALITSTEVFAQTWWVSSSFTRCPLRSFAMQVRQKLHEHGASNKPRCVLLISSFWPFQWSVILLQEDSFRSYRHFRSLISLWDVVLQWSRIFLKISTRQTLHLSQSLSIHL